jgi:hypothetical protein
MDIPVVVTMAGGFYPPVGITALDTVCPLAANAMRVRRKH